MFCFFFLIICFFIYSQILWSADRTGWQEGQPSAGGVPLSQGTFGCLEQNYYPRWETRPTPFMTPLQPPAARCFIGTVDRSGTKGHFPSKSEPAGHRRTHAREHVCITTRVKPVKISDSQLSFTIPIFALLRFFLTSCFSVLCSSIRFEKKNLC